MTTRIEELREEALGAAAAIDTFAAKGHSRQQIARLHDAIVALAAFAESEGRRADENLHLLTLSTHSAQVRILLERAIAAEKRAEEAERQLNEPQPPYPFFWRTEIQRAKTRWHKLMNEVNNNVLPNLRSWKQRFKSARGTIPGMAKRIAELEREVERKTTVLASAHVQRCICHNEPVASIGDEFACASGHEHPFVFFKCAALRKEG